MKSIDVRANGLRFHVQEAGEGERLALCLHGFPELGYSWRHQMPLLAELGYRVWAPDMRGYGQSERPVGVESYAMEHLIDDVASLIDAAGARKATLIAHDWGGLIAWHVAMRRPEMLERLVIMNLPHPVCLEREARRWRQFWRSWYVLLFQIPGLPERMLARDDYSSIDNSFIGMAYDPSRFTEEDLRIYREAAARPGAITAMLNYYRAHVRGGGARRQARLGYPVIETPTLMIWGELDTALGKETTFGTDELVRDFTLRYISDASHWVQQEAPETVNAMLSAWLRGERVPEAWETA